MHISVHTHSTNALAEARRHSQRTIVLSLGRDQGYRCMVKEDLGFISVVKNYFREDIGQYILA